MCILCHTVCWKILTTYIQGRRDRVAPRRGWVVASLVWCMLVVCRFAVLVLLLIIPLALSYSLDHEYLWKVEGDGGRRGGADGLGQGGGEGHPLRGQVAVVLEGYRGLGYEVTRALQALGATVVMACPDRDTSVLCVCAARVCRIVLSGVGVWVYGGLLQAF